MLDLLWIPISFLGVLSFYSLLKKRSGRRVIVSPSAAYAPASALSSLTPDASASACVRILEITSTNNSYDPMGDVLASLELDQVPEILGGPLYASMEGYMP